MGCVAAHGAFTLARLGMVLALVVGAGVTFAPAAGAHVPFLEPDGASDASATLGDPFPGAVDVPDASISRAVYGTLAGDAVFDVWLLEASKPTTAPVVMLVPVRGEYGDLRPSFVLVGAGLPSEGTTPDFVRERLRMAYPERTARDNIGAVTVVDPGEDPRSTFYEPFSFTRYYEGGETTVELRRNTSYHLVVFAPDGGKGEYALGVARAEQFTAWDVVSSVVAVVRIKLGLYGQGAFHPWAAAVLAAALGVLTAVIALPIVLVRRNRRRRQVPPTSVRR